MNDADIVWDEIEGRYRAYLFMYGERRFLGSYQTPEDAAIGRQHNAYLYVQEFLHTKCES